MGSQYSLIQFRIEQERRAENPDQSSWQVTINLDLENLGPMQAKIHLIENRVAIRFIAEKPATTNLINDNLPALENSLIKAGLSIAQIDVSTEMLTNELAVKSDRHLLDEEA